MFLDRWSDDDRERLFRGVLMVLGVGIVLWARVHLLDSPRPWFDEGIYLQAAKNIAERGIFGIQLAPDRFASLSFVTVGYPLLVPLAVIFKIFGATLEAARWMMVTFLVGTVLLAGLLARRLYGRRAGVIAALLLATFPPMYGNGKNVLGEVPGLFFLFGSCLLFLFLEQGRRNWQRFVFAGAFFALTLATKPSFFVLGPALAVALIVGWRRGLRVTFLQAVAFIVPFALGMAVWFWTQFGSVDPRAVFGHYANPYGVGSIWQTIWHNLKDFLVHPTPLHFLAALSLVTSAWIRRGSKRITLTEWMLAAFVLLTFAAYFRTVGWYRYFFFAHVVVLMMLPAAITFQQKRNSALGTRNVRRCMLHAIRYAIYFFFLANAIAFYREPFPLYGRGWREVRLFLQRLDPREDVLFANATEAAFFYHGRNYRQYLRITDRLQFGEDAFVSASSTPPYVIVTSEQLEQELPLEIFERVGTFDHTSIWRRREGTDPQ